MLVVVAFYTQGLQVIIPMILPVSINVIYFKDPVRISTSSTTINTTKVVSLQNTKPLSRIQPSISSCHITPPDYSYRELKKTPVLAYMTAFLIGRLFTSSIYFMVENHSRIFPGFPLSKVFFFLLLLVFPTPEQLFFLQILTRL